MFYILYFKFCLNRHFGEYAKMRRLISHSQMIDGRTSVSVLLCDLGILTYYNKHIKLSKQPIRLRWRQVSSLKSKCKTGFVHEAGDGVIKLLFLVEQQGCYSHSERSVSVGILSKVLSYTYNNSLSLSVANTSTFAGQRLL